MRKDSVIRLFVGVVLSGLFVGCVSFDNYDEWHVGAYEAEAKELERFENLSLEYEYIVGFDAPDDAAVIREATGTGTVEDGVYRFAHDAVSGYAHFHIELEALQEQKGGALQRVAFLARARNRGDGFVEVYPGGNISGSGGNPLSVEGEGGLMNDGWALVEFVADGDSTIVRGHNYERIMDRPLESLSIFCFNGALVELDYILFD